MTNQSSFATSSWLSKREAAAELGTSERTIDRMVRDHKIEMSTRPRHGRRPEPIYNPTDVEALKQSVKSMVVAATSLPMPQEYGAPAPGSPVAVNYGELIWSFLDRLQSSNSHEKAFLSLPEASERTGLSMAYLRRLAIAGDIVAFKDRGWKLSRRDLDNLDTSVQIGGTSRALTISRKPEFHKDAFG